MYHVVPLVSTTPWIMLANQISFNFYTDAYRHNQISGVTSKQSAIDNTS